MGEIMKSTNMKELMYVEFILCVQSIKRLTENIKYWNKELKRYEKY